MIWNLWSRWNAASSGVQWADSYLLASAMMPWRAMSSSHQLRGDRLQWRGLLAGGALQRETAG